MTQFKMLDKCLDRLNQIGETGSIGVTLFISSTVMAGDLIHPTAYFKVVKSQIIRDYGPFEDHIEKLLAYESISKGTKEIFLKNIELYRPIPQEKIDGPIAISVDSIDGFIYGKLDLSIRFPELAPP